MTTGDEDEDEDEDHRAWNDKARNETPTQQLDRNWSSLLQELRVVQTGVQLLTGFLLTLPFQARFDGLSTAGHVVYLMTVSASMLATILLVAPVSMHRLLFRQRAIGVIVRVGNILAISGLAMLGVTLVGAAALTFEIVLGVRAAASAAAVVASTAVAFWFLLPRIHRRR
ncbi:DUF6328 family protein [Rhodococcoides fascians]|uniref:DUF6328 family protein n=1 Tax=Nocardiaceae TaxID=85025 RepID=UPI00050CBB76|nr:MULTISPECIES: DUF6328 family protein [Rhodococcus]KJU99949.1 hypothetical protein VF34_04839 [Rhodococcus sp. PML026]WQH27493.1 DUF6328 family protein [Rhodococcus fascians]